MQSLLNAVYDSEFLAELTQTPIYIYESEEYKHITPIPQDLILKSFYGILDETSEKKLDLLYEKENKELWEIFNDVKNGKTLFTFTEPHTAHDKKSMVRLLYVYTPSFYKREAVQVTCFEVHEKGYTDIEYIPNGHTTQETARDFIKNVPQCESGLLFYEPWNN